MQRIDENTYIDDTLVTCAEYQLFIDEMREQGKYYQPDHWTSYQFPEGQAGELILGIRHSDAVAFCEWLTQREAGEWKYRLPTREEVNGSPLKSIGTSPLGYWVGTDYQFTWAGSAPNSPRVLGNTPYNHEDFVSAQEIESNGRADEPFHHFDLNQALTHVLALSSALDLDRTRILASELIINYNHYNGLNKNPNEDDHYFERDLSHNRDLNSAIFTATIMTTIHVTSDDNLHHERAVPLGIEMYIDLITLQERIAGRSPAFEGIRLVKERTR